MGILQKQIHSDFTVVHNAFIRDGRLSMAARGLLMTMISLPPNWNFSIKGLAKILPEGEKAISNALNKLTEFGYFKRERITGEDGRVIDWSYTFSDEPVFLNQRAAPQTNSPQLRNGDVANGDVSTADMADSGVNQINNNKIKNNQIRNDQSLDQSTAAEESTDSSAPRNEIDRLKDKLQFDYYLEIIKQNIGYDGMKALWEMSLYGEMPLKMLEDITTLMTRVVCSKDAIYHVDGQEISHELMKACFLKLREDDIQCVIDTAMRVFGEYNERGKEIRNKKGYLISMLYNSPTTKTANYLAGM